MSEISNREKRRRFVVFSATIVLIVLVLLFLAFAFFGGEKQDAQSSLKPVGAGNVHGGAGGEGTAEYNEKLTKMDDQKAQSALKAGESHIPTPIGKQKLLVRKEDTPPAQPKAPEPVRVAQPPQRRTDNAMLKRMMEDLDKLDARLGAVSAGQGAIVYLREVKEEAKAVPAVATENGKASPDAPFAIGDMLYAVINTGVNSDVPSPVMATVTGGKYRKTRLIGHFQRHDERLVLTFTRALPPGGEAVQISAYAVDPDTTHASVASSVDTHFFERWGGLVASAFLEGLGDAKRYSGSSSTIYGNVNGNGTTDQMVWGTYSPEDQAWIAAGKVGEKASKIFERGFDRPPTVYLDAGSPIGVLIMDVKQKK